MSNSLNIHRVYNIRASASKHNGSVWLSIQADDWEDNEVMEITFFIGLETEKGFALAQNLRDAINAHSKKEEPACIES